MTIATMVMINGTLTLERCLDIIICQSQPAPKSAVRWAGTSAAKGRRTVDAQGKSSATAQSVLIVHDCGV
jgi:hypothetical protein